MIKPTPSTSTEQVPTRTVRILISLVVVLHFGAILVTYAANNTNAASPKRSRLQEQWLAALQPYLIGGNWYTEMLPVEWYSDDKHSLAKSVSVQFRNESDWTKIVDSQSSSLDQSRQRQLLAVMWELAVNDDNDGLSRIMLSMVKHLESASPNRTIERIRFEKRNRDPSDESDAIIFEGTIARFEKSEIGLIPRIESRRSVPPTRSDRGKP